jgi:SagB-type dehydrogenase family enzyme
VEEALGARRSVRDFENIPISPPDISQLLWAAQGITHIEGLRTAPSAGALYPLETYIVVGSVSELPAGVYRYKPDGHEMERVAEGDRREQLCDAALSQPVVKDAAAVIVLTAVYERTTWKYGERGIRYVQMEAGHAVENVCLQAITLGLGTVVIGAFEDHKVKSILSLPRQQQPLYLVPVGKPSGNIYEASLPRGLRHSVSVEKRKGAV